MVSYVRGIDGDGGDDGYDDDGGKEVVRVRRPFCTYTRLDDRLAAVATTTTTTTTTTMAAETPVKGIGHICAGQHTHCTAHTHTTLNRYTHAARVYNSTKLSSKTERGYYFLIIHPSVVPFSSRVC